MTASMAKRTAHSGSSYEGTIGFSRAVRVGDRVVVSGTAPIWPDGTCDPDPEAQARRCLDIILAALAALGATPEDVVRTRMYLVDPADADAVGRAHAAVFGAVRPAATMVVVAALLDPRWRVEIEAEAMCSLTILDGRRRGRSPPRATARFPYAASASPRTTTTGWVTGSWRGSSGPIMVIQVRRALNTTDSTRVVTWRMAPLGLSMR